jgi:hypothetical protein
MLTLESSHVTDNIATGLVGEGWRGRGGGIYNQGGTVALRTGSSVTGNSATNGEGGGIHNSGIEGNVTLQSDSRVTGNTAATGGGIYNYDGTVTLEGPDPSPIVVNNCLNNCVGTPVDKCAATPVLCRP